MNLKKIIVVVLAVAVLVGIRYAFPHPPPLNRLVRANSVLLYEGLPHQFYEQDSLQQELKTRKTVISYGFPFYKDVLPLTKEDAAQLTQLVTAENTFKEYGGPKKCGGFHPDYAIEWQVGSDLYQVLICFGCEEAKWFGPGVNYYYDIQRGAAVKLQAILTKYRSQRPPYKEQLPGSEN